jgi:hypothetical protein
MFSAPTAVRLEDFIRASGIQGLFRMASRRSQETNPTYITPFSGRHVVPRLRHPYQSRSMHPHVLSIMLRTQPLVKTAVTVYPPTDNIPQRSEVALDLINNLDNMEYRGSGAEVLFPTDALNKLIKPFARNIEDPGRLHLYNEIQLSTVPHGGILPLEMTIQVSCSEIHAITGVRVYIV